jgi:8-oxo-dGTP pyrophosphatase MutT (NUDIX family)
MRALVQAAYAARTLILATLKIRTQGVKIMLFNDAGELLLIRNSYGNPNIFVLPGGGVGRGEAPATAARREVKEELGLDIASVEVVGTYRSEAEGKRDTIHLFRAVARGALSPDPVELAEACFFALDDLPDLISPATLRRIAELSGQRPVSECW